MIRRHSAEIDQQTNDRTRSAVARNQQDESKHFPKSWIGALIGSAGRMVSGCLPINSFAVFKPDLPRTRKCCAACQETPNGQSTSTWMYPGIHQSVTYFPDLVTTSGERIFNGMTEDGVLVRLSLATSVLSFPVGSLVEPNASAQVKVVQLI